jgi:PKD repeat protein
MAACVGILALPAAGAVADDSAPVVQATVYASGAQPTQDSVSPSYLLAHPGQCPVYAGGTLVEYGRTGPEQISPNPTRSWTLGTILGCLQTPIAVANVTGVTVFGSDGSPQTGANSQIIPADLATPSDFLNTAQNPVVQAVGYTQYDRPQRSASDLDYLDEVSENTPLAIEVFEGPPLKVSASASQTTVTVGGSVDFSAAVSGNNGSALSYNWSFGGGASPSTQVAPRVQFNTAGVWTVNLEVTDADGGGGGDQVSVTVTQPGTSSTPAATGPTTTGPDKSTGTTPGAPPAKKKKTGTPSTGTRHTHGNGPQTTSTHSQTTTTSTTPTTTTQTTPTPAAGSSGGGSSGSSGPSSAGSGPASSTPAGGASTHHKAPAAPTHRRTTTPTSPPSGALVHGELISDVVPLPANRSPLVHLASATTGSAPARQAPERRSVLPIIGAVLAVLALLALGAQRELGGPRWWRATRWWRGLRLG